MSNLNVQSINDQLVVDSRLLCRELDIEHKALKQLIRTYESELKEFGHLDISNVGVSGTSSYETFYFLNEDQCYFTLTLNRNNTQVVRAKVNLIKAFKAAREALEKANQPKLPQNYIQALEALLTAEKEKEALTLKAAQQEQELIQQEQTIKVLEPKAQTYDQVIANNTFHDMAEVAKIINIKGMGRNNLFEFLRNGGVLMRNNSPYQNYANQGYFKVVIKPNRMNINNSVTLVSPKGIEFIIGLLEDAGYRLPQAA